jgi:hypothetical protein
MSPSSSDLLTSLKKNQNIGRALVGGLLSSMVLAILFSLLTLLIKIQIAYFAIPIGILIGLVIRKFGQGIDLIFGFLGGAFALLSCLLSNLMILAGTHMLARDVTIGESFALIWEFGLWNSLTSSLAIFDLIFYTLAAFTGFRFAFFRITIPE